MRPVGVPRKVAAPARRIGSGLLAAWLMQGAGDMRLFLRTLVGVLLASGIAIAEEPTKPGDPYRKWPVAIEAQLAPIGSPIGVFGAAADVALIPQLSLSAGMGLGAAGPQLAAAVRPRIPVTPEAALEFTAGYSRGNYTPIKISMGGEGQSESFVDGSWVNADVGFQVRFESGTTFRLFGGASKLVACGEAVRDGVAIPQERWPLLPYAAVAIGYALHVK